MAELPLIEAAFSNIGVATVRLSFGWGSSLPVDGMWRERKIPASAIRNDLLEAERQRVFSVGEAGVFLDGDRIAIKLCHEGDLHIEGEHAAIDSVLSAWRQRGYEPRLVERLVP